MSDDAITVDALRAQLRELRERLVDVIHAPELREQTDQRLREMMVRLARLERGDPPSESDSRPHRLPPEPPGRQWLKHAPGVLDCYIIRRRFTTDDGESVRPDEVICPGQGWWEDRPFRTVLVNDGYAEPLSVDTLTWQCPHMRFFATPEAFAEHGCADLPPSDDEVPEATARPTRPPYTVRGLDWPETVRLLRLVLALSEQGVIAGDIGRRLGSELGDKDIADGTVRSWRRQGRKLRARGLI